MKCFIQTILMIILAGNLLADVYYVRLPASGGSDANGGSGWGDAFATLTNAITVASAGDEVWVLGGETHILPDPAGGASIVMKSGVSIYGHFRVSDINTFDRDLENVSIATVLNCSLLDADEKGISFGNGTESAIFDGFLMTGIANKKNVRALSMYGENPFCEVRNCRFTGNIINTSGASIHVSGPGKKAVVSSCHIYGNSGGGANGGAGIVVGNALSNYLTVVDCVISNNTASVCGAAVNLPSGAADGSMLFMERCFLTDNQSKDGGAVAVGMSSSAYGYPVIWMTNCVVAHNTATDDGAGIIHATKAGIYLMNCTVAGNSCGGSGSAVFGGTAGQACMRFENTIFAYNTGSNAIHRSGGSDNIDVINNCLFYGNTGGVNFLDRSGNLRDTAAEINAWVNAANNLVADPKFVSPTYDLRLREDSAACNAARAVGAPTNDVLSKYRPNLGGYDIGAYEYHEALKVWHMMAANAVSDSADVSCDLVVASELGASLWVYYGTNDAEGIAGNWQTNVSLGSGLAQGSYTTTVSSLQSDTRYWYRFFADDGATNVSAVESSFFGTTFDLGQAPSNVAASGFWDQNLIYWEESFDCESGFVIERCTNSAFTGETYMWAVFGIDLTNAVDNTSSNGVTYYYRVAATNEAGMSDWSEAASAASIPSIVVVSNLTLTPVQVFELQKESQKMALRGVRGAGMELVIAGVDVPSGSTNAFYDYGANTNSSWYIDPNGTYYKYTWFREPYLYPFDFGNGVTSNLPIVPVALFNATNIFDKHILINLAYTGEIKIGSTNYIVEVVQGASPEYKDRLEYPGYFDDPAVNILLYDKATTNRLPGIGRLKNIEGTWYCFQSNPSGEKLSLQRIDGVGNMVIDAGPFWSNDFAFVSGSFETSNGWQLSMNTLDFSSGSVSLPGATYTFSQFVVSNATKCYTYIWHNSFLPPYGSFTVPPGGDGIFRLGQKINFWAKMKEEKNPYTLYGSLYLQCQLFDGDIGGAVMPMASEENFKIFSFTNSIGSKIVPKWTYNPYVCGWNGVADFLTNDRESPDQFWILPIDTNPPSIYDTRVFAVGFDMKGLFGFCSSNVFINVKNEHFGLHAKFYDFDTELTDYPDFDNLLPDIETATGHMSSGAVETPWIGLPEEMADTFAARYEFDFIPISVNSGSGAYTFYLLYQGAARLYRDDQLMLEGVSTDYQDQLTNSPVTIALNSRSRMRLEYYHNTGRASLTLRCVGIVPPGNTYVYNFNPDKDYFKGINSICLPGSLNITGPTQSVWTAPADLSVDVSATHPDGIDKVEVYVDGLKISQITNAPYVFNMTDLPVNAQLSVRSEDLFGYGSISNLDLAINREAIEDWLSRHAVADPDPDADADGDGVSNQDEFYADTDPTNPVSVLKITNLAFFGGSNCVSWTGTENSQVVDYYELLISHDLNAVSGGWATVRSLIPVGQAESNNCWTSTGGDSNAFYRIRVVPR